MQAAQLQIRITLSLEQINPIVQDYLQTTAADHVKGINQTTCDRLRSTLNAGLAEGESIDQLKNRVAGVFTDAKGYRSQMIARTETAQAYSYANEQALEATGVVNEYQWLTAQDERVCPICGPLHGERRNAGQQYTSGLKPAFAHNSVPMQRDWTREGDCVFQEYRCEKCNKLLFRGSLKLLLGKKHSNEASSSLSAIAAAKSTTFPTTLPRSSARANRLSHCALTDSPRPWWHRYCHKTTNLSANAEYAFGD